MSDISEHCEDDDSESFVSSLADSYLAARKPCHDRGYHVVEQLKDDQKAGKSPMICYECEVFFGVNDGIEYRVQKS